MSIPEIIRYFLAPKTGNYEIELWGASGEGAYYDYGKRIDDTIGYERVGEYINGGAGAYIKRIIKLDKNEKLYIYVGEMGKDYSSIDMVIVRLVAIMVEVKEEKTIK